MIDGFRRRASLQMARIGLSLLERSGVYSGYFADWRWAMFDRSQQAGLHILPVHYYSPVPDVSRITIDDTMPVFAAADAETLSRAIGDLEGLVDRYGSAYSEIAHRKPYRNGETIAEFRFGKAPYSTVEAEVLYGLIRSRRPRQIVEIGCGHTTLLIAEAIRAEADDGYAPNFECIEPYRPAYLASLPPEVTSFRDTPLQAVPIDRFRELEAGDILFIDSSHVVSYGSDTVHEMLTILPVLRPGVLVHVHDIFLPYEYPSEWLKEKRYFWNEQYMLSALVNGSSRYRIKYPLHQLFRQRREDMTRLFPLLETEGHRPGAYWLEISDGAT